MVETAGRQAGRQAGRRAPTGRTDLLDVAVAVHLVLVREEEVAVDLVDEHLEADARVHGVRAGHHLHQAREGVLSEEEGGEGAND